MKNVVYCTMKVCCYFKNEENMCTARGKDMCTFSYTPVTKPPIGVMSREMWNRQRRKDLADAMARYLEAGMKIPVEWIEEYNEINDKEVKK